jgi:hypothetical protein
MPQKKVYLNPEVHMLLHEVYFHPRERLASRIDEPIVEDNVSGYKIISIVGMM